MRLLISKAVLKHIQNNKTLTSNITEDSITLSRYTESLHTDSHPHYDTSAKQLKEQQIQS